MATTFTWGINTLERETDDGFVFTAHWTITASEPTGQTDEDGNPAVYTAGAYGSLGLERPSSLIPYESLTEEIVVGWVKEGLGAEQVSSIESALADKIEDQKHPKSASGVPWNS